MLSGGFAVGRIEMAPSTTTTEIIEKSIIFKPGSSVANLGTATGISDLVFEDFGDRNNYTSSGNLGTNFNGSPNLGVSSVLFVEFGATSALPGFAEDLGQQPAGVVGAIARVVSPQQEIGQYSAVGKPIGTNVYGASGTYLHNRFFSTQLVAYDEETTSFPTIPTAGMSGGLMPNTGFWVVSNPMVDSTIRSYYLEDGSFWGTEVGIIGFITSGTFAISFQVPEGMAWDDGAKGFGWWRDDVVYTTADFARLRAEYDAA